MIGMNPKITLLKDISCYQAIAQILQKELGENWENRLEIRQNMFVYDVVSIITQTKLLSEAVKQSILTFLRKNMKQVLK